MTSASPGLVSFQVNDRAEWRSRLEKSAATPPPSLRVLTFNDLHGRLCPIDPLGVLRPEEGLPARLSAWRDRFQEPVALVGAGDDRAGTLFDLAMNDPQKPDPAYTLYCALGIDAILPGNHDLDWGADRLARKLKSTRNRPPMITTNLDSIHPLHDSSVRGLILLLPGGSALPVLGLATTERVSRTDAPLPWRENLTDWISNLPANTPAMILSHLGFGEDQCLRAFLQDILGERANTVLIAGGHTHDLVPARANRWEQRAYVQAGANGSHAGEAVWRNGHWHTRTIPASDLPDARPTAALRIWKTEQETWLRPYLKEWPAVGLKGTVTSDSTSEAARFSGECPWMNLLADALRDIARDLVAANGSLLLAALCARTIGKLPSGSRLDVPHLFSLVPYPDRIATLEIPAAKLPDLLRHNAGRVLKAPGFLPGLGMLHFDSTLRHRYRRSENQIHLESFQLIGKKPNSNRINIITTAYTANGFAGHRKLFRSAGIESALDNARFISTKPFRDHLTESLRQRSIEAMLLRDGRFITERSPTFPMGQ